MNDVRTKRDGFLQAADDVKAGHLDDGTDGVGDDQELTDVREQTMVDAVAADGVVSHHVAVVVQLMNAKKSGLFEKEFKYETSMDGIASEAFGTDVTLAWRTFRQNGVERDGIILILPGGAFHWLPKGGFADEAAWNETVEIARKRLPKNDVDLIN